MKSLKTWSSILNRLTMTEYTKIENELLSLGWTKENASGDHVKFFQENNPGFILVSRSISGAGRALRNTYADIRRKEPRFSLGRQAHMLVEEEEQLEEDNLLKQFPAWMHPGHSVRWSGPENKDYSKLDDSNSVMYKEYIVCGFIETDNGVMVNIGEPHEGVPFPVRPEEIDAWKTFKCKKCGKRFPENVAVKNEKYEKICPDCARPDEKETSPETATAAIRNPENENRKKELAELLKSHSKLKKILEGYIFSDDNPINIPDEEKAVISEEIKDYVASLSAKERKNMRRKFPNFMSSFDVPIDNEEEKAYYYPLDAWNDTVERLSYFNLHKISNAGNDKEILKETKNRLARTYYTTKTIQSKKDKSVTLRKICITTPDWETTRLFCHTASYVIDYFKKALPDGITFIELNCPSAGFKQYLFRHEFEEDKAVVETVKSLLPEKEKDCFKIAELNKILPPLHDVLDEYEKSIEEIGFDLIGNFIYFRLHTTKIDDETDNDDEYETRMPLVLADIVVMDGDSDGEKANKIADAIRKNDALKGPIQFVIHDWSNKKIIEINNFREFDYPEPIDKDEENPPAVPVKNASGKNYREELIDGYVNIALEETDTVMHEAFWGALKRIASEIDNHPGIAGKWEAITGNNNKNEKDMEKDILNLTNPESENAVTGACTTRELLKELKSRGVQFDNLTIVVKQSINTDDI